MKRRGCLSVLLGTTYQRQIPNETIQWLTENDSMANGERFFKKRHLPLVPHRSAKQGMSGLATNKQIQHTTYTNRVKPWMWHSVFLVYLIAKSHLPRFLRNRSCAAAVLAPDIYEQDNLFLYRDAVFRVAIYYM